MCWPAFEAAQTKCKSTPSVKELPSWVCQGYGPHPGICRQGFAVISPPASYGHTPDSCFPCPLISSGFQFWKQAELPETNPQSLSSKRGAWLEVSFHTTFLASSAICVAAHSYTDNCTFPLPVCRTRAWQCLSTHECSSSQSHLLQSLIDTGTIMLLSHCISSQIRISPAPCSESLLLTMWAAVNAHKALEVFDTCKKMNGKFWYQESITMPGIQVQLWQAGSASPEPAQQYQGFILPHKPVKATTQFSSFLWFGLLLG